MPEEVFPAPQPAAEQVPSAPLESDVSRAAVEFAKHRENPEMRGASNHELMRQTIRSMSQLPTAPQPAAPATDDSVLPSYMGAATPATKLEVEDLLRVAFKEGIAKATQLAQKSNPFILDAFHDSLAGKLRDELKKRNMI